MLKTNTAVVAEHPDAGEEAHGAGSEFLLLGDDADLAFSAGLVRRERQSAPWTGDLIDWKKSIPVPSSIPRG